MSEKEKFESDLPVSEAEIEEVQEEKEKVSFLSSRKGRIILAASVGGVLLLLFLIFQTGGKRRVNASELLVLNGITKKLGFPVLSKDTTTEEAEWFKSTQHLDDVEHAHARLLSKVVQKNSFPGNKGIIANHCLNYLLTQTQNKDSSFFGAALSDFEPLLMKIMVESKMYKEIVDLAIQHNEKLLGLMNDHFKVEDYARFVKALNDPDNKQAELILEMKNSSHSFAKTAIYSHLLDQGFKVKDELKALEPAVNIDIFDYLILNTVLNVNAKNYFMTLESETNMDIHYMSLISFDLLAGTHISNSIFTNIWSKNYFSPFLPKSVIAEDASIFYRRISLLAAIDGGRIKTINSEPLTLELFEKCIEFLKQFSLEKITVAVLSLCHLFGTKFGKDEISKSVALKSFLFENFSVSKMDISLISNSNQKKLIVTFYINQGEFKEMSYQMDDAEKIPIEIISNATFKDSKVLIDIFEKLHQFGFKFESDALSIRIESLLMFIDSEKLRKLAAKLNLTFDRILSYNSITKKFDQKYFPYELISHPKVEKLKGVYKPYLFVESELLEYNENDDNFKIFSILIPTCLTDVGIRSLTDLVLDDLSKKNTGLVFDLQRYSICLNALIYFMNSKQGEIKTLHPVVKDFLRKDFPELTNV